MLIFYHAVPAGDIGEVLDNISNRQNDYMRRVLFDLSFFVWVGVLLFNIITGLMVDGFGSLREEDNARRDILDNSCFVCGLLRSTYDDTPNFQGPSFDRHKDTDHDFWAYVNFYVYLKRKDPSDYSGVETYVWGQISEDSIEWIPMRMSSAIQAAHAQSHHAKLLADAEKKTGAGVDPAMVERISADLDVLKQGLRKLESALPTH